MSRAIDVEKAVEIIEAKQKELCPVGRYGRNYVYGSDREKYDAWEEIIDALENLPTLTPPNEPLTMISMNDELPPDNERVLVYRPCMADSDTGPYSVQWGWAAKRDGSHWAHLPDRRPPGRQED